MLTLTCATCATEATQLVVATVAESLLGALMSVIHVMQLNWRRLCLLICAGSSCSNCYKYHCRPDSYDVHCTASTYELKLLVLQCSTVSAGLLADAALVCQCNSAHADCTLQASTGHCSQSGCCCLAADRLLECVLNCQLRAELTYVYTL
eukprot:19901-Heterococcus_DN1.PRE.11